MLILKKPEKKDDKFIAKAIEPIKRIFSDVKLKSIRRLIDSKGYNLSLYIPETINNEGICNINKPNHLVGNKSTKRSFKQFSSFNETQDYKGIFLRPLEKN